MTQWWAFSILQCRRTVCSWSRALGGRAGGCGSVRGRLARISGGPWAGPHRHRAANRRARSRAPAGVWEVIRLQRRYAGWLVSPPKGGTTTVAGLKQLELDVISAPSLLCATAASMPFSSNRERWNMRAPAPKWPDSRCPVGRRTLTPGLPPAPLAAMASSASAMSRRIDRGTKRGTNGMGHPKSVWGNSPTRTNRPSLPYPASTDRDDAQWHPSNAGWRGAPDRRRHRPGCACGPERCDPQPLPQC